MLNPVQKFIWNKREVTVILPKNYFKSNMKNYPALITQDGDYIFKRYAFTCSPEVIFIGLTPLDRNIEYTPWDTTTDVGDYTGEADKYLKMLTEAFIPYLHAQYRIDENDIGIGGGSFGALVSLYALLNYEAHFSTYIMLSPSLWYPGFLSYISDSADILRKKRVFWYVGGAEAVGRKNIMGEMVPNNKKGVYLVEEKLKHPESKLIFMTNQDGLHRHRFFKTHFYQAIDLFYRNSTFK